MLQYHKYLNSKEGDCCCKRYFSNGYMGLFDVFLKKDNEEEKKLLEKIAALENEIGRKNKEISDLVNEIEKINHSGAPLTSKQQDAFNNKQLELIEKNIKETKEENSVLKNVIAQYNLKIGKEKYYYKIDVYKFFNSTKFSEVVDFFIKNEIKYIQDLTDEFMNKIPENLKNLEEAKVKLDHFWTRDFIEWDIITYLNKGDKVSRIFSKSRKFTNILSDEGIEFMEDMIEYDFSKLLEKGFTEKKIEEFKNTRDSFYEEERVLVEK